jgi:hypothetical protein
MLICSPWKIYSGDRLMTGAADVHDRDDWQDNHHDLEERPSWRLVWFHRCGT